MSILVYSCLKNWQDNPKNPFLFFNDDKYSGKDLESLLYRTRAKIEPLVAESTATILSANNSIQWIIAYLAIKSFGRIPIIIDSKLLKSSIKLFKNERKLLIITDKALDRNSSYNQININKIFNNSSYQKNEKIKFVHSKSADIIFTSGTTSQPKGVIIEEKSYLHTTNELIRVFNQSFSDIELLSMPFSHSFGLARLRCALIKGSGAYVTDGLKNIPKIYDKIIKLNINAVSMVPSALYLFKSVLRKNIDNISKKIKYIEIGSSVLSVEIRHWLKDNFNNTLILHHYGMTEASRAFFCPRGAEDSDEKNWVGFPAKSVKFRLTNIEKDKVDNCEVGEIQISGKNLASGYYKNEDLTNKHFSSRWFSTGDLGYIKNTKLFLIGRKDGQINVGGNKVFSGEVEEIVKTLKIVNDCIAFPIEDEIYGHRVGLIINLALEKVENDEIKELLNDTFHNLPEYKKPNKFWISKGLPLSKNGKKIRDIKVINNFINKIK